MPEFDLRALIREVRDTLPAPDPRLLAKEVHRRVRRSDLDSALAQALPALVYSMISSERSSSSPGGQLRDDTHITAAAGGFVSSKVAGIAAWHRKLSNWINVGPNVDEWKLLRDCTASDLDYSASTKEEHARRVQAHATELRTLAALLTEHRVTTVGELPEAVLAPVLSAS
jgi:hypothetical protein